VSPSSAAVKPPDIELGGQATASATLQRILATELDHLRANQPAAEGNDAEGVHQMRVGIRRLRAGLVLFEPLLQQSVTDPLQQELRRAGQIFGRARDWDVFCLEMLPACAGEAGQTQALRLLRDAAEKRRRTVHENFVQELSNPRYVQLVDDLASWAADGPPVAKHRRRQIDDLAADLLDRVARKVDRRGRHLQRQSTEELHALRKSLKKLRYGADELSGLFAAKRVKSFERGCKALQEVLGDVNDAAACSRMTQALSATLKPGTSDAVGMVVLWSHHRRDAALRRLPKAWEAFCEAPRFWQ
jgi:triphosphatase